MSEIESTCFAAGTKIACRSREIAVEDIKVGELVRTLSGYKPVRWVGNIGFNADMLVDAEARRAYCPVVIRQGAISDGVPSRDLELSPDHAIPLNGVMVRAAALVNGVTVVQRFDVKTFRYYHLGFGDHEIIFANGIQAESYVDIGNAALFDVVETDLQQATPVVVIVDPPDAVERRQHAIADVKKRARLIARRRQYAFKTSCDQQSFV